MSSGLEPETITKQLLRLTVEDQPFINVEQFYGHELPLPADEWRQLGLLAGNGFRVNINRCGIQEFVIFDGIQSQLPAPPVPGEGCYCLRRFGLSLYRIVMTGFDTVVLSQVGDS